MTNRYDLRKTIADNVRRLRKSRGYNQTEFAEKVGLSHDCISAIERQKVTPSLESLMSVSELFDVSLDELVYGRTCAVGGERERVLKRLNNYLEGKDAKYVNMVYDLAKKLNELR